MSGGAEPGWLTAQQAADMLGISREHCYRLLADQRVPGLSRVGGRWRVSVTMLQQSLQVRKSQTGEDTPQLAAFRVGDRVEVHAGDYQVWGEVRAVFTTCADRLLFVVDIERKGVIKVYNEKQLRGLT